jgi:hypothetical protein
MSVEVSVSLSTEAIPFVGEQPIGAGFVERFVR